MNIGPKEKFEAIEDEVRDINLHWKYLTEILFPYGDHGERDILSKSSPLFFGLCRHLFYDKILLLISKLCDPASTNIAKQQVQNLSIKNLIKELEPLPSNVQIAFDKFDGLFVKNYKLIKNHRDKRIAHNDLEVRMQQKYLDNPSQGEVRELIEALNELCNAISGTYLGYVTGTDCDCIAIDQPEHFFDILRRGLNANKEIFL